MIILISIIAVLDSFILPVKNILTSIIFFLLIILGTMKIPIHKSWYVLSLGFITLATILYISGSGVANENIIHKLADWCFIFFVIGTVQLVRSINKRDE